MSHVVHEKAVAADDEAVNQSSENPRIIENDPKTEDLQSKHFKDAVQLDAPQRLEHALLHQVALQLTKVPNQRRQVRRISLFHFSARQSLEPLESAIRAHVEGRKDVRRVHVVIEGDHAPPGVHG